MELLFLLEIHFKDLLNPEFYIDNGGLWVFLFIVFAETGLLAGFFLPGDSLLFVGGIYSTKLVTRGLGYDMGSDFMNLLVLTAMVSFAGIIGNTLGYWVGRKSGPTLYSRKDSFFYKKKYLYKAKDFYDKNGAGAIVVARFLPIIRTFAPVIAGIVGMDKRKFAFYNILGSILWASSMLFAGHYLHQFFLKKYDIDLTEHLEWIILTIVVVTTAPVLIKLFGGKKKSDTIEPSEPQLPL